MNLRQARQQREARRRHGPRGRPAAARRGGAARQRGGHQAPPRGTLFVDYVILVEITRAAPLPCRPYPAALAFYRNFKVWGERVLLLGRPSSPIPPGNLQHDL